MKKIFSSIALAGLVALTAISCQKYEKAVFKTSDAVRPVLVSATAGSTVKVNYTPAEFKMNFNDSMSVYHTLGLIKVDTIDVNQTLSAAKDDTTNHVISIKTSAIAALLLNRGYKYGDTANLTIVVRASIQDPSKGVTNGYLDSEASFNFDMKLKKPSGGVYAAFTDDSPWSVIGKIASTGNGWNADEAMTTDGTWHVCEGITLTTGDEFKFRKDGGWTDNFGAADGITEEPFVVTIGEEQPAGAGGKNLAVPEDGTYDLLLNPDAGTYKIVVHVDDPYADYADESDWSVTGKIASTGNDWNADEEMTTDGTWHVCRGLELTTTDEFKFRKDANWDVNFGGDFVALDAEFAVEQDGANIKVLEDGTYDLLLNPGASVAKIVKAQ